MSKKGTNLSASVRERLANLSKGTGADFQQVLSSYAIERLLYRLSVSKYQREFILKGATLFTLWEGFPHRQTRDVDLLGFGKNDVERIVSVFSTIVLSKVSDDGLTFAKEVRGEEIGALQEYGGIRIMLIAILGTARIPVSVDVGFGDSVSPAPREFEFPTLLDFPKPKIRAYPVETVIAEKVHAIVVLGIANSRMKDYFDLWHIAQHSTLQSGPLETAVKGTFGARRTELPKVAPVGLTSEFSSNPSKTAQWRAFGSRVPSGTTFAELPQVVSLISSFLMPVLFLEFSPTGGSVWAPGGPWRSALSNPKT